MEKRMDAEVGSAKAALRRTMKARRAAEPDRAVPDGEILKNLFSVPAFSAAEDVFIYYSLPEEADTHRIIGELLAQNKRVYLPRTEGKDMIFVRYAGGPLQRGRFGVFEPAGEGVPSIGSIGSAVCILPLLAADRQFHRLGYGGGYYDRFLSRFGGEAVGLCYSNSTQWRLPHGRYDRPVDVLVTDKYIRSITKR